MNTEELKAIAEWFVSRDTGISSETMAAIHLGAEKGRFNPPLDPSDFGRCYRLLEKAPSIRASFSRIGQLCPAFKPLLDNWDELCDLFKQEASSGRAPRLYRRMQDLLEEHREQ
ncbi:hypothetical protein [Serratia marcescens]|uniref:hypothetical protein n=1 Tax=Serratia marcescens TaxID=615 RepID=UPI001F157076|nr:hypothetical protein [Serratia marcescens]MDP8648028.1 hypothetical protein [Serratia marcescens]MDP8727390.1 hypothetical protein [Serratia marcescens]